MTQDPMPYDTVFTCDGIEYGLLRGGPATVFIKPGLGSDPRGFGDKYPRMACRLRDGGGCTVMVASNPHDGKSHAEADARALSLCLEEQGIKTPELCFFGNSNGCIKGLELASRGVSFRRMVLVNMPLMINFHRTKGYLAAIPHTSILAVYGALDPSISYVPFLEGKFPHVGVRTVPEADHNFKGMTEDFISLCDFLMK